MGPRNQQLNVNWGGVWGRHHSPQHPGTDHSLLILLSADGHLACFQPNRGHHKHRGCKHPPSLGVRVISYWSEISRSLFHVVTPKKHNAPPLNPSGPALGPLTPSSSHNFPLPCFRQFWASLITLLWLLPAASPQPSEQSTFPHEEEEGPRLGVCTSLPRAAPVVPASHLA